MPNDCWPLFDLEVHTPRLSLRYADDELSHELVQLAARGIHEPGFMPFAVPWTDLPSPQLEQEALRFYWQSRADARPARWRLIFAVILDGQVVGASDLFATRFVELRQFETGSWLGREFQGQGIGKEMRLASLTLGFEGLGAEWAMTSAWNDNAPSLGVTRALGYEQVRELRALRHAEPDTQTEFRMGRDHWDTIRDAKVELRGVERARRFLGLDAA